MHPFDNPIRRALVTRQAHLGRHRASASRFEPEVSVLAGFDDAESGFDALAAITEPGERVGVFVEAACPTPGFDVAATIPLLQMAYEGAAPGDDHEETAIVALGDADAAEMQALAELTKPGPFNRRTHEMGEFVGIRVDERLVAMAGQRLRVPGHTEISAICTHPDHLGRGHGAALTRWQIRRIVSAGERPFLHVRADNDRAVALYERLGFVPRWRGLYLVLQRAAAEP